MRPRLTWVFAALAALALAALALPSACGRGADWAPARLGDTYTLVEREATPRGLREIRETWTLADTASGQGAYRIEREGHAPATRWRPLPSRPAVAGGCGGHPAVRGIGATRVEWVHVPAGRFRCAKTWRSYEEHEGRVMRVDEWWAAGVPVPVQRWTRWEGHASGALSAPPRRPELLVLGAEWTVLERIARR